MQLYDMLFLTVGILVGLFSHRLNQQGKIIGIVITLALLLAHTLLEGFRWQLLFSYLAGGILLLMLIDKNTSTKRFRITAIFLALGGLMSWLFPLFQFPNPSGQFTVGHQTIQLEDTTRLEEITSDVQDYRKLLLQVWYPSESPITNPNNYLDDDYAKAFAESKGFPALIVSHFEQIKTNTQSNLPIAQHQTFPLLVLSHGLMWNTELYTSFVEEIVSQGYIVVGIDHTFECPQTFIDGKVVPPSYENLAKMNEVMDFDRFKQLEVDLNNSTAIVEQQRIMKDMVDCFPGYSKGIDRWSDDISFVLESLSHLNQQSNSFLYQRLNMDQIGSFGHSWGGAAVAQNAAYNPKVKAVVNLDGAQWGRLVDTTLAQPFLCVYAERDYQTFFTPNFVLYDAVCQGDQYQAIIQQSDHASFGDLNYFSGLRFLTQTGSIPPERMAVVTNALLLNFFDKYLKKKSVNLDRIFNSDAFEEVNFEVRQ